LDCPQLLLLTSVGEAIRMRFNLQLAKIIGERIEIKFKRFGNIEQLEIILVDVTYSWAASRASWLKYKGLLMIYYLASIVLAIRC